MYTGAIQGECTCTVTCKWGSCVVCGSMCVYRCACMCCSAGSSAIHSMSQSLKYFVLFYQNQATPGMTLIRLAKRKKRKNENLFSLLMRPVNDKHGRWRCCLQSHMRFHQMCIQPVYLMQTITEYFLMKFCSMKSWLKYVSLCWKQ